MSDEVNITARENWFVGADKDLRFTIYQADSRATPRVAQDITGWTMTFVLYDGDRQLLTKTVGAGIALTLPLVGIAIVTIDDTDTDALAAGSYGYELWRTNAGAEDMLAYGTVILRDTKKTVA